MKVTKWLTKRMLMAMHDEAVALFGGHQGLRDEAALDATLDHAKNLLAYGDNPTAYDLAAALCQGIAKNKPFMDGNIRTSLLAAHAFLHLNGIAFEPLEEDERSGMKAVGAAAIDSAVLSDWFRSFSTEPPA
jgi:death-on-curing protein